MANNYEIKIVKLYCAPTLKDGDKDYESLVTRIEYDWIGTSESGTKGYIRYTKDLDLPGDDYVDFDKLVEADMKVWVSDTEERADAITLIDKQIIAVEENKFQETIAPWVVKSEPQTSK
tara:strand:- start:130 stop:486 length:357 start_codon:yes stop_codon:yes gene_type:complete